MRNVVIVMLSLAVIILLGVLAHAGEGPGALSPVVAQSVRNDSSQPLRSLPPVVPTSAGAARVIPRGDIKPSSPEALSARAPQGDAVVQDWQGISYMPLPIRNFEGINNLNGVLPPDTNGDVGPNHYVQTVNLSFAIWDKNGTLLYGPANTNTIWTGFGGPCETTNDGDPVVLYDHLADRWLISQFALPNIHSGGGPFYECIAVSKTGDPTGEWHRYEFLISNTKMNDYPKLAVWRDGYYMSVNQFTNASTWGGAGVVAFERSKMLSGQAATMIYFDLESVNASFGGMLPSDLDGPAPPAGTPNYFVEVDDATWIAPNDAMRIWEFHVDWTTPANSTFGLSGQPNLVLNVAPFDLVPCVLTRVRDCVPQPGVTSGSYLDVIGDRLMHRLQYRYFGTAGYGSMVVNHSVDAGGRVGVRWYELRKPAAGNWTIRQQGTYSPDSNNRWMGSIAMDKQGNLGLGYSVSSETVYPSIRYSGRLVSDPLNTLPQAETTLISGTGSQTHSASRWGDYSMMAVDPSDNCTFWYTQEYVQTTGSAAWQTRIGSFRFPSCTSGSTGVLEGTVKNSATNTGISGASVKVGSLTTITDAAGFYKFAYVPVGTFTMTVSAFSYTTATAAGVAIAAGQTTTKNFSLDPLPAATVQGTVKDGSGHTWPLYAKVTVKSSGSEASVFTDPATGQYSIPLYQGITYAFTVEAMLGGYKTASKSYKPVAASNTLDFTLLVDAAEHCAAPGYKMTGILQEFEGGTQPSGWTVKDNAGSGAAWMFNNPGARTNLTGGTGGFAIADSDYEGTVAMDTELISPAVNFSTATKVILEFDTDFNAYEAEIADVDISSDGGATWLNVWRKSGADYPGPAHEKIDVTAYAAGKSSVKVRFHYFNANYEYWWQVDNVVLWTEKCVQMVGGIVAGIVSDANTGSPLAGATVKRNSSTSETVSDATGTYVLFSPEGSKTFTASNAGGYANDVKTVTIVKNTVVRQDFSLMAGKLTATPVNVLAGININNVTKTAARTLTLKDTGGLAVNFQIAESGVSSIALPRAKLSFRRSPDPVSIGRAPKSAGSVQSSAEGEEPVSPLALSQSSAYGVDIDDGNLVTFTADAPGTWTVINNIGNHSFFAGDFVGGDTSTLYAIDYAVNKLYTVNTSTAQVTEIGPSVPNTGESWTGMTAAYGGAVYAASTNISRSTLYTINTSTGAATVVGEITNAPCIIDIAISSNGQMYGLDICSDSLISIDEATGAGTAVGSVGFDANFAQSMDFDDSTGILYLAAYNNSVGRGELRVADTTTGNTSLVGPFPNNHEVDCLAFTGYDVAWLSETPLSGSVTANGGTKAITLNFTATGLTAKNYRAVLTVFNNTPYGPLSVPVTLSAVTKTVQLFTPNGGETLKSGSKYTVEWGALTTAAKFNLSYSTDNGATWKPIISNRTGRSFLWTVPADNSTQCRFKVVGLNGLGTEVGSDISDGSFTIEP